MQPSFFAHLLQEFTTPLTNPVLVFSLILFIILLAPLLLSRIKVPGIIGLILSGVVIGPHGFNILIRNSAVELFSTIGLLYIMFIAGLELDLNEFKKNKYKSLLFGFFTFIIPLAIGYPVCRYLLQYNGLASFLTASMFATHTLVAYPIVSKFGIAKNQAVAITVGGTILTDTAVLIILAVIMGSRQGELTEAFWLRLGISLAVFAAIMFLIIPRIAQWFFSNLESEKTSHYIFVLAVVFFAAFLAEVAGVEPIIGAFVAGLALNSLIPHSSALMNRIEFIGNAIFIPFFLISVGMLVNVRVLLNGPTALIVAFTLTLVALAGKWLAAFFTQLVSRYSKPERNLIFGLSSAHAAATLAVILVGFNAKILDENILNGTIILILATCVISSFVTENAAKQTVLTTKETKVLLPQKDTETAEHLLLPITNLTTLERMLEFTLLLKSKISLNPITVLSVVPNNANAELNLAKVKKDLEASVKIAAATETNIQVLATMDYNIARGIARTSREILADSIVLAWPKRASILERYIGDKTETILTHTNKNIFICHLEKPIISLKRIVLVCLPLTELEVGFPVWLGKILKLATELSLPVSCYCNQHTQEAITYILTQSNSTITPEFTQLQKEDAIWSVEKFVQINDLLVVTAARKDALSYQPIVDAIPKWLEKEFSEINKIIIYPKRHDANQIYDVY
ncbi:cation:proton antiporter [Adhaeribacter rhizoryzae]|uniref:Cation:proton antiporter n=1 Tax=Adhaeribacter rhizoryzae TaxID=2607907 RepID=A0A5M6D8P9_9BACT|nr:cation:proton antiporter [Adhaeribacter rhizoryzae]KAA5542996.1 cation:proton antiporter [Adhaeribacter rhizoryzae]